MVLQKLENPRFGFRGWKDSHRFSYQICDLRSDDVTAVIRLHAGIKVICRLNGAPRLPKRNPST
jgi:hypothetical protein